MSMHRQQARKKVRVAQAVALVFAAGAVAAVMVPRPDPSLVIPPADQTGTTPAAGAVIKHVADLSAQDVAPVLAVMNTYVEIKEHPMAMRPIEQETPVAFKEPDPPKDIEAPVGWRFVGSIISPRSSAAIINDEHNKQHVIFTGDKLNGTTLVAVAGDHVVLRDGDENSESRQLPLEARPDTLLPNGPSPMASASGQIENPQEYLNFPADYNTMSPESQRAWTDRRNIAINQMKEGNARNPAGTKVPPPGGRAGQRPGVQQPGKQSPTGKDYK